MRPLCGQKFEIMRSLCGKIFVICGYYVVVLFINHIMSDYCVKKLLIIPEGIVFAYSYLIQYILLTAVLGLKYLVTLKNGSSR